MNKPFPMKRQKDRKRAKCLAVRKRERYNHDTKLEATEVLSMGKLRAKEYRRFEGIRHTRDDGGKYWQARELAPILDYTEWRNFTKAKAAASPQLKFPPHPCLRIPAQQALGGNPGVGPCPYRKDRACLKEKRGGKGRTANPGAQGYLQGDPQGACGLVDKAAPVKTRLYGSCRDSRPVRKPGIRANFRI